MRLDDRVRPVPSRKKFSSTIIPFSLKILTPVESTQHDFVTRLVNHFMAARFVGIRSLYRFGLNQVVLCVCDVICELSYYVLSCRTRREIDWLRIAVGS